MCFFDLVLRRPLSFGLILLEDFEKLPNVKVNEGQAEVCSLNSAASITSSRRSRGSFKVIWGVNFHRTGRAGWEGRGKVIPPMQLQICTGEEACFRILPGSETRKTVKA